MARAWFVGLLLTTLVGCTAGFLLPQPAFLGRSALSRQPVRRVAATSRASLGDKPAALDVVEWFQPDLSGKTCLLTGGNCGIGLEAAKALASRGCRVVLTSRDVPGTEVQILNEIRTKGLGGYAVPDADVRVVELDLSDFASIERCAAAFSAEEARLDFLVLNAGVGGVARKYTKEGFEWQMGVNHFGHFRLVQLLLPSMLKQAFKSRVVTLSSTAHFSGSIDPADLSCARTKLLGYGSYAHSKLANLLFARGLDARLREAGASNVVCSALHPGVIRTVGSLDPPPLSIAMPRPRALCAAPAASRARGGRPAPMTAPLWPAAGHLAARAVAPPRDARRGHPRQRRSPGRCHYCPRPAHLPPRASRPLAGVCAPHQRGPNPTPHRLRFRAGVRVPGARARGRGARRRRLPR
jgi:NAD(P)-dependent dehydrogenase (short-subunit alcohol dehydrogenase family)